MSYRYSVNNDFWSRVRWFANDFHEWRSHEWKSLANHLTSDQQIVIHGNECIISFLTHYFISWTNRFFTNNHPSLLSPLSLRTVISDLTLWCHHSWSVTSREREALALWRHIHRLFLHAQIGVGQTRWNLSGVDQFQATAKDCGVPLACVTYYVNYVLCLYIAFMTIFVFVMICIFSGINVFNLESWIW